jgi:hypothetical protein
VSYRAPPYRRLWGFFALFTGEIVDIVGSRRGVPILIPVGYGPGGVSIHPQHIDEKRLDLAN